MGELLDHLRSELRQLDRRCAELELLLHDLTIRYAVSAPDPGLTSSTQPDADGA